MRVTGKYVNEGNPSSYLELKSDGTFYLERGFIGGATGKYEIEGKQITLKFDGGMATRGQIEGKTITVTGDNWTRQ